MEVERYGFGPKGAEAPGSGGDGALLGVTPYLPYGERDYENGCEIQGLQGDKITNISGGQVAIAMLFVYSREVLTSNSV